MTRSIHTLLCLCVLAAGGLLPARIAAAGPEGAEALPANQPVESGLVPSEAGAAQETNEPAPEASRPLPPRGAPRATSSAEDDRGWFRVPGGAWRTIGALALVLGLIAALRSAVLRFGGPLAKARAPSGIVEVLGRFPLSRGQTLLLLKVDRRILLLSQSGGSLSTLSEITDAEQVASLLQRLRHERGDSFTRQFERLVTPVVEREETAGEAPVIVDLTRRPPRTPAQRLAAAFTQGAGR
ncbi:MAG: flagellar biosynthetic protein FliO [Phycisphaerales bacterium]|nr:flagellar biosynthetic protein FliO [Phycisphaerales bacterium]